MGTAEPFTHAALICTRAVPAPVSSGTRKATWYTSLLPGSPTWLIVGEGFPLTNTSTGEVTMAKGAPG